MSGVVVGDGHVDLAASHEGEAFDRDTDSGRVRGATIHDKVGRDDGDLLSGAELERCVGDGVVDDGGARGLPEDFATGRAVLLGGDSVDAFLINKTHTTSGQAQFHITLLALYPETVILQIRQETASCLVMSMGYVVTGHRSFTGDLAYSGHLSNSK